MTNEAAPEIFRPTGPSVWFGKEMTKTEEWIFHLPKDAIAEIDECVRNIRANGKTLEELGPQDFPFQAIADDIRDLKTELATGRGFVIVRGVPAEKYTPDELGMIFWGFGSHFGTAMPQSFLGDRLGTVMNLEDEEPEQRLRRAYHSGGQQFVHTDTCDIVGMISIATAKSGGASRLASAHTVHNLMLDYCPELLATMYEGFISRMPDSDAEALGIPPLFPYRVPAYRYEDGWLNCHFVRGYVLRAEMAGDHHISVKERAAMDMFASLGNHGDVLIEMLLEPGDFQIFNNRTILHGRAHFDDYTEKSRRRHLKRLWLSVPDWPPMPAIQSKPYGANLWKWRESALRRAAEAVA